MEFISLVHGCLAQKSLEWKPSEERLYGETLDISVYRFPWFSPVWYYCPRAFPNDKMLPGYFIGISKNVGDGFSYRNRPEEEFKKPSYCIPTVITRSVVRRRNTDGPEEPPRCQESQTGFDFWDFKGNKLVGDDELDGKFSDDTDDISEENQVGNNQYVDIDYACFNNSNSPTSSSVPGHGDQSDPQYDKYIQVQVNDKSIMNGNCLKDGMASSESSNCAIQKGCGAKRSHKQQTMDTNLNCTDVDSESDVISITSTASDDVADDVNNHLCADDSDYVYHAIVGNHWLDGIFELEVVYGSGNREFHLFDDVKSEQPKETAQYILHCEAGHSTKSQRYQHWERHFLHDLKRSIHLLFRVNRVQFISQILSNIPPSASQQKRKKPGRNKRTKVSNMKFRIEVPNNWADVLRIDREAGNRLWKEEVEKEVGYLRLHKCFKFCSPDYKLRSDYQYAPLRMVYDVKPDLTRKACLVIQGHRVDPRGISTRDTVVKGISVRLLDLIAHRDDLEIICGDIGNAFIQADTKELCYTRCGVEFGSRFGCIAIIIRALYGLTMSAERWRSLFADFLLTLGFFSVRYDRDVWMKMRDDKSGYDYICTHVDDFKIVARKPHFLMNHIKSNFLVKSFGDPEYYLGNNFHWEDKGQLWTLGCKTYTSEAIRRIENIFGPLPKNNTPLPERRYGQSQELDVSPLLGEYDHRLYQMLIGMAQWLVTIGRPDICFSVSSLSRFNACPREMHLSLALHIYGSLKKSLDKRIAVDSRDLDFSEVDREDSFKPDFLEEYPGSKEDIDPGIPTPTGRPLQTTI